MTTYVELHAHSNFSFLDGASHIEEMVFRARELGYGALALTDHDGLYGAMEFAQCARAWGLRPITGAEVTVGAAPPLSTAGKEEEGRRKEYHLTLLCESQRGYANLCRILTHAHLDNERGKPRVEPEVLARHPSTAPDGVLRAGAEGLIALSGCRRGEVPSLVAEGRYREAEEAARWYARVFGPGNYFIELQNNFVHGDVRRNRLLAELAEHIGIGVVATGNVHYHARERHRLQDVLVAIKNRSSLDACHRERRANSEYYLKRPEEMASAAGGFSEFPEAVANTVRIAERCEFDLTRDLDYRFPEYPVPEGETQESFLRKLCYRRAEERYPLRGGRLPRKVEERLEQELALVERHGLSGFFLIHHEIFQLAREVAREVYGREVHGPPGRGRGSSVGSIICYLIGLSHIDPVANDLFLGRFLNDELASVPDIDLDFSREVREKLILRVYKHFGGEHTGLVATFPTYKLRSAVREVGKALGLPPAELDRLAKVSEGGSARDVRAEMERLPHFRAKLEGGGWRHLAELAEQIAGFPRHISQHVGGMVISSKPLVELVPLEQSAMEGRVLAQWDKDSIDDARMIKIDFLALGMLSAVDETLDLIEEHRGKRIDLSRIDFEDGRVYDGICEADTMGVFQIESRAQMQTLPRVRPRSLEDLTVQVAIIRPGPIVGGAVNPYIRRRMGKEPVTYDHPSLESALKETLGVILYQEQVLQAAMAVAGFSAGQAESLRRAMSRKRSAEAIAKLKREFVEGCLANGASRETAETVFRKIQGFAEFGFPKAHAAAFGLLAYQSAWLRTYYPAEALCALYNAQPMGFYAPHVLTNDGKRHGVTVLPPDINRSAACTLEPLLDPGPPFPIAGARYLPGNSLQTDGGEADPALLAAERPAVPYAVHDFGRRSHRADPQAESWPDTPVRRVSGIPIGPDGANGTEDLAIRIGLRYVKGLSLETAKQVEAERIARGEFRSLFDFIERTSLKREAIENLIAVGAFDSFGLERRELIWQLGLVYRPRAANRRQRQLALPMPVEQDMPPEGTLRPMTDWERMRNDYAILGLSPNYHPMALLRPRLSESMATTPMAESLPDGAKTQIAGLVVCRQRPGTARGFVFMVIEDEFGVVNVIVRPDLYERQRDIVRSDPFVVVRGEIQRRDSVTNVMADSFARLNIGGGISPAAHNFGHGGHGGRG